MMELESFRVDRQVIAVARIPHLQWVCLLRPFVLLDALQLLARRASLLSRGRGGGVRGLNGVGRGQGGRSHAQRACCVVAIFCFCWRPMWPFGGMRAACRSPAWAYVRLSLTTSCVNVLLGGTGRGTEASTSGPRLRCTLQQTNFYTRRGGGYPRTLYHALCTFYKVRGYFLKDLLRL